MISNKGNPLPINHHNQTGKKKERKMCTNIRNQSTKCTKYNAANTYKARFQEHCNNLALINEKREGERLAFQIFKIFPCTTI